MNVVQGAISSIRKKADEILNDNQGWFRGGQFTPGQQVQRIASDVGYQARDFANQTAQKAWSPTGVLGGSVNTIQSGINNVSNWQRFEMPKPQVQSPIGQTAINLAMSVPESIVNIPRNYLTGIARTGQELGTAYKEGRQVNLQNIAGGVAPLTESLVDIGTFGGGTVAKNLLKEGTKQTIKQGIVKQGLKGAGMGALGGLTYGVDTQYGKDFNVGEVAQNVAGGALLGGVIGGGLGGAGAVKSKLFGGYKKLGFDDKVAEQLANKHYIRSENVRVKFNKDQVKTYAEINKVLGRNVKTPVFSDDLKTYNNKVLGLPNTELGLGMTTKNVSRDKFIESKGVMLEGKTTGGIVDTPNRNLQTQADISVPTGQTELPVPNKSLLTNAQDSLALPQGEIKPIIVKTRAQLKKTLANNPNANVRIELTPGKGKIATLGQVPDRAEVAVTLPSRLDNFIEDTLGYSTIAPKGGNKKANLWTSTLRKGAESVSTKVEEGLSSENPIVRNAASTMQNFFRGLGMSPERASAAMELRGGMSVANERAYNVMDTLYQSLGHNKKSLERINAVLDPELATTKVTFDQLSKTEKQVYGLIREGLDLVHDTSYANGHISQELYLKNKGRYVPRLYDVTELPAEVNKFVTQSGKKIDNNLYKQRTDVDAWKIDNSLNDPVYALGKRLAQVETNGAIKKYTDFLASNSRFISDVERPGFTKLSDSPAYGALSGKYVLNSAAEDLKGFFFANQGMQNLYDVFRAYDRMPIRQLQKKLLTVFNPTTNVGNIVSDQVFGFVTGVDPLTLNKNLLELKNKPKLFKQLSDYLMKSGITGTDITRTDFTTKLGSINELASGKKKGWLTRAADKQTAFYGGTDDAYKVSALKSLLDKGFTLEEATRKVADGFQNYSNVGKFYDVWAKTPIIGKPFIKFQGDLIRIIKNGAVNNPLGLIGFLGTLYGVAQLSSKLSGETPEDYKTRTERFGAPMIPGLNIPLTWQTPIGELNVARYISPFFANNDTTNIASNMLPFTPNIDTNKDVASNIAMNVNDPLVSPLVQLGVNRDFRGKPISDPNENKYQPSTLTPEEKLKNQAVFTGRAYLPPPVNSAIDVPQVAMTGKNMYGSPQTVGQSVARLGGIKISDMSPDKVEELRTKDASYQQYKNESLQQQIRSVQKQQLTGEITDQQAQARINNLQKDIKQVSIQGTGGDINYINENGSMLTISAKKLDDIANLPTTNKYQEAIKESKQYSMASTIMDNTDLSQAQQQQALQRLGIDPAKASYYQVANDNTNLKTMFVLDSINKVKSSGGGFSDIIQSLANQRTEVNGQMIASNAVIDNLVDENILTKAQATELKKYKFENGQLTAIKKLTANKGKKPKKISITSRRMSAPPKLSSSKPAKSKRLKLSFKKLKPIKLKVAGL